MWNLLLAQSVTDATGWSAQIEKGGIVFVLLMAALIVPFALHREWVYTRSYVKMLLANSSALEAIRDARYQDLKEECKELKQANRDLQNLVARSVGVAETVVRK